MGFASRRPEMSGFFLASRKVCKAGGVEELSLCLENKPCSFFLPFSSFESGSHDVTQADLELTMETEIS